MQIEQTELLMAVFGAFDENIKQIEREMKNDGGLRETIEDIIKNIRDN